MFLRKLNTKYSSKFIYYEQFQTDIDVFALANAILMVVSSALTLKLVICLSGNNDGEWVTKEATNIYFRVFNKFLMAMSFAIPHFLLAVTRLIEVILVQQSNSTCMVNHLADDKPPLGMNPKLVVRRSLRPNKSIDYSCNSII